MRKLIAGMRVSVDGKMEGADGVADWVESWSDGYDLLPHIDACVLGGGMYPNYEQYWTAIREKPSSVHPLSGNMPTPAEVEWARFAARTPHYVLSNTVSDISWPNTTLVRDMAEIADLKNRDGKDIYLVGGARIVASFLDAGLVDELRFVVYPLVAGAGKALFATTERRRGLDLRTVDRLPNGLLSLTYGVDSTR